MRLAVLSDIHANSVALDAVIASFDRVDAVWHLGDVVGYGPDPNGVIDRLQAIGASGVQGNHDAAAIGGAEIDWFNPVARTAMIWTRDEIDDASRAWLAELPVRRETADMTLVHGSPRDPTWEYVTSVEIARDNFAIIETTHALHGHTHRPIAYVERDGAVRPLTPDDGFTVSLDTGRAMLNPGSVGQPRDGSPEASYLVLDTGTRTCTWHRVPYDIGRVQAAMRTAGLPRSLVDRLTVGA